MIYLLLISVVLVLACFGGVIERLDEILVELRKDRS
jgi:hypothetical protein